MLRQLSLNLGGSGGGAAVPSAGAVLSNGSVLSSVAAGNVGNVLTDNGATWVSQAPSTGVFNPTSSAITLFDDFANTVINKTATVPMGPFYLITSNSNDINLDSIINTVETNRYGVINITCDATHAESGLFGDVNEVQFGGGTIVAASAVNISVVPNTTTNNYDFLFGYSHTWPNISDGVVIAISTSVNAANWVALTYKAGTPTIVNLGVPFAALTWFNLRIQLNSAGTTATFFINGSQVGTSSTNITTSNVGIGYRVNASSANATNAIRLDWLYQSLTPTTPRGTF